MQKKKTIKKKADWITKTKKRKAKKKDRGIVDFMMIMHHFFRGLPKWIDEMTDPRNLSYTTYTQSDLVLMGLLKNVCAVKTMRSMEEEFNEEACIETLRLLSGDKNLEEMPHYDTLNYYLITQIADIVMQVYLAWNPLIREINQTIKNIFKATRKLPTAERNG